MKKKRFDTGGSTNVRTRSDDEIGDTNPRTGVYTPGSYAARQEQGQKNLDSVKGFFNKLTGNSSDDSDNGAKTRGLRVNAAPVTYDENPAAKYIRKSVGQESTVSRPGESTISGSQVDKNKNYESEATPTPAPTPAPAPAARRLPITIEGDYPKKNDTAGTSVEEEAPPPKKEVKKTKVVEKPKSETPVPTKRQDTQKMYPSGVMGGARSPSTNSPTPSEKKRETYRDLKGKVQYKEEEAPRSDKEWGTQNIKRNLQSAPSDIMSGLKKAGSAIADYKFETPAERRSREAKEPKAATPYSRTQTERDDEALTRGSAMKRGGAVKKMASGGMTSRSSASSRGDGIASRGKTRGKIC